MKTNRLIVRIIAIVAVLAMLLGFGGCVKSYNSDPTVVKCGSVKLGLQRYLNAFKNSSYYQYYQYGYLDADTYKEFVLNELISYGVQLDQAKKQGITLTAEEEEKVKADVEEQLTKYLSDTYKDSIDKDLTDATEIYNAEMELFVKDLKANGTSLKAYRADLEESIRNSALVNKLRDSVVGDITVNDDDVKSYFNDNMSTTTAISTFNSNFSSFISGSSSTIPSYMPIVKAEEPAEGEEAKEPNPYDELFSVLHLLVKFETAPEDDVTDLAAYAAEDSQLTKTMQLVEEQIPNITAEQFINDYCFSTSFCEDPGMDNECYQYFGYIMSEALIDSYYEGFGEAAMKLKYPDWEPKAEEETSETETEEKPEVDHNITPFTLSDGTQIMRVFSGAGVHYVILNPNNWNAMYDEEGKLQVVLYDGENPVKEGDAYKTINGTVTEEQFNAMQEAFSHVGDKKAEDFVASTCKTIYDYFKDAALTAAQNTAYNAKFTEWKDATKIKINESILKGLSIG